MATSNKKTTVSNEDELTKLKSELETKNKYLEDMSKRMEDLQKAFISLQAQSKPAAPSKEAPVELSTYFIEGVSVYTPNMDINIRLRPYEFKEISAEHMKMLLQTDFVRKFLRSGVIYFKNPEDYDRFDIIDRRDISNEKLTQVLTKERPQEIIKILDEMTDSRKDDTVTHCIFFKIVDMVMNTKLQMTFDVYDTVEKYFNSDIKRVARVIQVLKENK